MQRVKHFLMNFITIFMTAFIIIINVIIIIIFIISFKCFRIYVIASETDLCWFCNYLHVTSALQCLLQGLELIADGDSAWQVMSSWLITRPRPQYIWNLLGFCACNLKMELSVQWLSLKSLCYYTITSRTLELPTWLLLGH